MPGTVEVVASFLAAKGSQCAKPPSLGDEPYSVAEPGRGLPLVALMEICEPAIRGWQ